MRVVVIHSIFLICSAIWYIGDIRLPKNPTIPTPMPLPTDNVTTLTEDLVFVCDSDVECVVLSSPKNRLKITSAKGPMVVRGKFVDSPGKVENREFKGPFLYFIEPNEEGPCELIIVPVGGKEDSVLRRSIVCQLGPRPPPDPKPKPPEPQPDVSPIPEKGLHVLIIYDPKVDLTPQQNSILYGAAVANWLAANCAKEPDGKTPSCIIAASNSDFSKASKKWQDAFARPRKSLPWVIISNSPKGGYEGALPANQEEFLNLVNKYK